MGRLISQLVRKVASILQLVLWYGCHIRCRLFRCPFIVDGWGGLLLRIIFHILNDRRLWRISHNTRQVFHKLLELVVAHEYRIVASIENALKHGGLES